MTLQWQKQRKSFTESNDPWGLRTGWNWINIAAGKMSQVITSLTNITFLLLSQVLRLSFITIMLIHHFCNKNHCTSSPSSSHGWANARERAVLDWVCNKVEVSSKLWDIASSRFQRKLLGNDFKDNCSPSKLIQLRRRLKGDHLPKSYWDDHHHHFSMF